jgi:hypothetical protein
MQSTYFAQAVVIEFQLASIHIMNITTWRKLCIAFHVPHVEIMCVIFVRRYMKASIIVQNVLVIYRNHPKRLKKQ